MNGLLGGVVQIVITAIRADPMLQCVCGYRDM